MPEKYNALYQSDNEERRVTYLPSSRAAAEADAPDPKYKYP